MEPRGRSGDGSLNSASNGKVKGRSGLAYNCLHCGAANPSWHTSRIGYPRPGSHQAGHLCTTFPHRDSMNTLPSHGTRWNTKSRRVILRPRASPLLASRHVALCLHGANRHSTATREKYTTTPALYIRLGTRQQTAQVHTRR